MFSAEISYQKGEKWNKTGLSFGSVGFWNILGTDIWTEEDSSTDSVSFTELFHISHIWKNVTSIWDLAVNFWENLGTTMFEKESVPFIQAHWVQQQNDSMTEGIPSTALLSVDLKPRKEGLYLTAFFRSMRISKSGYADWVALCELGKFLCEQADLKLKRITTIGGSVHLGDMNNEKKNVRELFRVWNS